MEFRVVSAARRLAAPLFLAFATIAHPAIAQDEATPTLDVPDGAVGGMGDINLYPKRIVISDRQRIATVGLYNRSIASGEYEIKVNDLMMTPDGQLIPLERVADPAQLERVAVASDMLRWSPRRVSLASSESQTVRIMARPPRDLPPGEYRSHFVAISVPDEAGGFSIEQATQGATPTGIGVRIVPRFGISIPIIVRVGDTTLETTVQDIALAATPEGRPMVEMTINRSGNRSAFGDVIVTAPGREEPVAIARGIGIYPEIDARRVTIPVDAEVEPAFLASGTRLTVTYIDDDFAPGETLFRQDFIVP